MYAIIATGGKQYKVSEGDVIRVEKLGAEAGSTYTFDQVLAVCDDTLTVGTPIVEGVTVTGTVIGDGKGKKVVVYKYKRKSGYHKKQGHRQLYTEVKIESINDGKPHEKAPELPEAESSEPAEAVEAEAVNEEAEAEVSEEGEA